MSDKIQQLEERIEAIEHRNARVEQDKAWETSWVRIGSIIIITYLVTVVIFFILATTTPLLQAIIPTLGFTLSVQSLPIIKRWWLHRQH